MVADVVDAIQIKYGNMPIAMICKVSKIVVTDKDIVATDEVIGMATGSTCSNETQKLAVNKESTVEETIGVETAEGGEINWSTSVSVQHSNSISVLGVKSEVTVGIATNCWWI